MRAGRIDCEGAERAFAHALQTHRQAPGQFFLAKLLGFDIRYPDERCVVAFEARDFMANPRGQLHGGIIALAMDVSMGHLIMHLHGPAVTLELKTQYLRSVAGGPVRAEGSVLRRGGRIWFMQSRLLDADGELAAVASATWSAVDGGSRATA